MAYSKIILNGETLMDVTSDTVAAGSLLSGKTATKNDGTKVTGNIASKTASDLTASGATVTAAAGYYPSAVSKAVTTTTHPNPTAAIASSTGVVTATHTQTTGYVTSGTTTGTLNLTTQAGKTVTPTESAQTAVASYRWTTGPISVAAISSTYVGTGVTTRSAANLTASGSNVTAPAGYYSSAVSKSVAAGSAFPPAVTITKNPTIGVNTSGVVTATYTGSSSITPTVTSGYVSKGTAGTVSTTGTSTYQLTSKAAATYYPSTADQTIASQRWLVGNQTIKSVTTSNLTAANIKSGTVVKVGDSANASRITQVTGTLKEGVTHTAQISGGGNSSNCYVQYNGTKYYTEGQTFTFYDGDVIYLYVNGPFESYIQFGGGKYSETESGAATYSYTAIGCNTDFNLVYDSLGDSRIEVNFINSDFTNYRPELALDYTGIENQITPTTQMQHINPSSNCYGLGQVVVKAIPDTYVQPSGTYNISSNGTYNISSYANADVNVSGGEYYSAYSMYVNSTSYISTNSYFNEWLNNLSIIGSYMFFGRIYDGTHITLSFSKATAIKMGGFGFLQGGGTIGYHSYDFPICSDIGPYAFTSNIRICSINAPKCSHIQECAFLWCTYLTTINFPKCYTIGYSAFSGCQGLTAASFPVCTTISGYAFAGCSSLSFADFPICTTINTGAFAYCPNLSSINFPICTSIGSSAFSGCASLTEVNFPECETIHSNAFSGCTKLTTAYFPKCSYIKGSAFKNCYNLISLYFTSISSIPTFNGTSQFYSTPISNYSTSAGRYGSIFVPASLYNSFITATGWAAYSSRVVSV